MCYNYLKEKVEKYMYDMMKKVNECIDVVNKTSLGLNKLIGPTTQFKVLGDSVAAAILNLNASLSNFKTDITNLENHDKILDAKTLEYDNILFNSLSTTSVIKSGDSVNTIKNYYLRVSGIKGQTILENGVFKSTFEKEGKLELRVTGRNIVDEKRLYDIYSKLDSRCVYKTSSGEIGFNGYYCHQQREKIGITYKPNTQYCITLKWKWDINASTPNSQTVACLVQYTDGTSQSQHLDSSTVDMDYETLSYYTLPNKTIKFITISYGAYQPCGLIKEMSVVEGTEPMNDTEYEPYQEDIQTLTLAEPLRSVGNVRDDLEYQRIKCVYPFVPKGTTIATEFTHPDMFGIYFLSSEWDNAISDKSVEFDKIPRIEYANQINSNYLCYTENSVGATIIGIPKSLITGWNDTLSNSEKITKANAFITSLNLTMLYQLATPVARNLQALELPTQGTKTYVSFENVVQPYDTFNVTTATDIENKLASVQQFKITSDSGSGKSIVSDFDNMKETGIYTVHSGMVTNIANSPTSSNIYGTLLVQNTGVITQLLIADASLYFRSFVGNPVKWEAWTEVLNKKENQVYKLTSDDGYTLHNITDFNILNTGEYNVSGNNILNAPATGFLSGVLRVYRQDGFNALQTFIDASGNIEYRRGYWSKTWQPWYKLTLTKV